jgi:cysteine-rich repeat protein
MVCDRHHLTCVYPVQIDACRDKGPADPCNYLATDGACDRGVCLIVECGNGVVQPGEACDDGNNDPGDGCSADCLSDETCGNSGMRPHEVAALQPNDFGLYDTLGNQWEWVNDLFDYQDYPTEPVVDPWGAVTGTDRMYRGACYGNEGETVRAADRNWWPPTARDRAIGFRIGRTAP